MWRTREVDDVARRKKSCIMRMLSRLECENPLRDCGIAAKMEMATYYTYESSFNNLLLDIGCLISSPANSDDVVALPEG